MAHLSFRKLTLTEFRNYERASLDLDGRPVVLTGPNGAGKTNILEAVSILSPGRGLRSARLDQLTRRDTPLPPEGGEGTGADEAPRRVWAVSALLDQDGEEVRIGTGLDPQSAGAKRVVRVEGVSVSGPGVLSDYFSVVWLTPQLDRLFSEGASQRRRFLDRLVLGLDPGHAAVAARYERASRDRLKLLERAKEGQPLDQAWMDALEEQISESGVALAAARLDFVDRLRTEIEARAGESAFPAARLHLEGPLEDRLRGGESALDVEDWYRNTLKSRRAMDGAQGRTGLGPNRSDLEVFFAATGQAAKACSTGEQKALLIGIVLANARLKKGMAGGAPPILLLDEIAAHLDPGRRVALFDELIALGAQAFLTGTEQALFEGFGTRAQYLHVDNGCVTSSPTS